MDETDKQDKWRWKNSGNHEDRTRRDEAHRHGAGQDNVVVYRQKKPDQRRREKMKKRWSVRPDVSLVVVPPGKQCHMISAVVLIFFGLFLAVAGIVVLFILKNLSTVVWAVGIGMLVVGLLFMIAGLIYMLCMCCFRTSTRYKQYVARYKQTSGESEISEVSSGQMQQSARGASVGSMSTQQSHVGNNITALDGRASYLQSSSHPDSEATSRTYVTANEHTPSIRVTPNPSDHGRSNPERLVSGGYRPLKMNDISDFSMGMQTADEGDFDYSENGHHGARYVDAASTEEDTNATAQDALRDDLAKLEEALREMVMNKSEDQEMVHLMNQRGPIDTSTPVNHNNRVLTVPIVIDGDNSHHRATPPNPIPPSYDQVIKNYRTYSRSASPTHLMESDI